MMFFVCFFIKDAVYLGPTSVSVDASQASFQFYTGGVYYDPNCSSLQLDHSMLNVGWGTQDGSDYWIVANSWGADWGNKKKKRKEICFFKI